MSQYSKQVKQQVAAYDRNFSTTLNNNYKNAFLQCKRSGSENTCNEMTREVNKVEDTLKKIKALELEVSLKVNKNKKQINNEKSKFQAKKTQLQNKISEQKNIDNVGNAASTLRNDTKSTLYIEYFYLAFYIFSMLVFTFILKKFKYSWKQIISFLVSLFILVYFAV